MAVLQTVLAFMLALGGLILFHELGHFTVAKLLRIRVEVFSIGFGPRLLGFRRGTTDYRLSAIPFGGYVRMMGELPGEQLQGSSEEFLSRPRWQRFLVLVMGAVMNLVLAVLVMWGLFYVGLDEFDFLRDEPVVGFTLEDSPAESIGLEPGDRILSLGGDAVPTWEELTLRQQFLADKRVPIRFERGGEVLERQVHVVADEQLHQGQLGIGPRLLVELGEVQPDGAADRAGLLEGDVVLSVNGERIYLQSDLVEAIRVHPDLPMTVRIARTDAADEIRELDVELIPEGRDGEGWIDAIVGQYLPKSPRRYALGEALVMSVRENVKMSTWLLEGLQRLFSFQLSARTISGPLYIAKVSGDALRDSVQTYLRFIAFVSLQLGILNLLPIPVLDGGHIFILLTEAIIRRDLSMRFKEGLLQIGFLLLLSLMVFVLWMDIDKIFFSSDESSEEPAAVESVEPDDPDPPGGAVEDHGD